MPDAMPGEEGDLQAFKPAGDDRCAGLAERSGEVVLGDIFQPGHAV